MRIASAVEALTRLLDMLRKALWALVQHIIWHTDASRSQLDQIIWRLEANENHCPPDTKAALHLARLLRKRVYNG